jgi:hypothetical protein
VNELDNELQYYYEKSILSDNRIKFDMFLKQYLHENINKDEFIYEIHKFIPLYYFS